MAYCTKDDLMLGKLPLPPYVKEEEYIKSAADEIDAQVGFIYSTPIDVTESEDNPVVRPARLLLKHMNALIASGRMILAMATATEDDNTHSYGRYLLAQGHAILKQIVSGQVLLEGADPLHEGDEGAPTGPLLHNEDSESNVEAFYNRVMTPGGMFNPRLQSGATW